VRPLFLTVLCSSLWIASAQAKVACPEIAAPGAIVPYSGHYDSPAPGIVHLTGTPIDIFTTNDGMSYQVAISGVPITPYEDRLPFRFAEYVAAYTCASMVRAGQIN
jgi:hypothetical protein